MASTTSSALPAATSDANNGGGGGGNGPSSPLLFFVALGFGVVFTNLWIIVGVKYCFRYNQRNRARLAGEDHDGVDLNNVPRQRRRREKKLMTIDEVNERFPLIKYKTWRSTRADQGLPTAGGITNTGSRPASIRDEPRKSQEGVEAHEIQPKTPTTSTLNEKIPDHGRPEQVDDNINNASSTDRATATKSPTVPEPALVRQTTGEEEAEEDGDRIQTAIPAEQLPDPGDTCAICIDTIEEDDDIRGLTCGHAFHASCVDPWLTSRRACCPLCKADYYVPKPRPEGAQDESRRQARNEQPPQGTFSYIAGRHGQRYGRHRNIYLPVAFLGSPRRELSDAARTRNQTNNTADAQETTPEVTTDEQNSSSWRQRLPNVRMPTIPAISRIRRGRGNDTGEQPDPIPEPSPAQLEAGRAT